LVIDRAKPATVVTAAKAVATAIAVAAEGALLVDSSGNVAPFVRQPDGAPLREPASVSRQLGLANTPSFAIISRSQICDS
jgi:hypothetical protein